MAFLNAHPLCAHCEVAGQITAAEEVDHIVPLSLGGLDTESNFQPLCKSCHSSKTSREFL